MFLSEKLKNTLDTHRISFKNFGIVGDIKHELYITAVKHLRELGIGNMNDNNALAVLKSTDTEFRNFCKQQEFDFGDFFFQDFIVPIAQENEKARKYFNIKKGE